MRISSIIPAIVLAGSSFALPKKPLNSVNLPVINPNNPKATLRSFSFDQSCNAQQRQFITRSFRDALKMIDNVLNTASAESIPFKTFFDARQNGAGASMIGLDAPHFYSVVEDVFKKMKTLITTTESNLHITCEVSQECKEYAIAWAKRSEMQMNFCPYFFNYKRIGMLSELKRIASFDDLKCKDDGAGALTLDTDAARMPLGATQIDTLTWLPAHTVVHELAHLFPAQENGRIESITDCYYGCYAAEFMAIHAPDAALANADNYAWFSTAQYLNTLCGAPDQDYYRATADKWYWLQQQTFQKQLASFEKKRAVIVQLRGNEEQQKAAKEKLRLSEYDQDVCSMHVTWPQVQEIMKARPGIFQ